MAGEIIVTTKQNIKNWFKTNLIPTQSQFWNTFDSFWHKEEKIPISSIDGLDTLVVSDATAIQKGVTKLYTELGLNEDGTMTQKVITELLATKVTEQFVIDNKIASNFLRVIVPTDTPEGTASGYWLTNTAGTYTNFGGLVVTAGKMAIIGRDAAGNFSISQQTLTMTPSPTSLVASGNAEAVSGNTVFKATENFKSDYRALLTVVGVNESVLGYYNKTTGVFTSSASYRSIKFPVVSGVKYYASGVIRGTTTALAAYYNSAGVYLGNQHVGTNGVDTVITDELLVLPANTSFIGMSTLVATSYGKLLSKNGDVDIAIKGGYNGNLKTLEDFVNSTNKELFGFDVQVGTPETATGYYLYSTGAFSAIASHRASKYPIDATKEYIVDAITFGTGQAIAVYFDASGNWIGFQTRGLVSQTTYKSEKLIIPANAVTVGLAGFSSQPILRKKNTTFNVAIKGNFNGTLEDLDNKKADKSDVGIIQSYGCAGDSISFGSGGTNNNTSWCDYLATRLGVTTFLKVAIPGHSIWVNLKTQLNSINTDLNYFTIMIGINDITQIIDGITIMGNLNDVLAMANDFPNDSVSSELYNHSVLGRFRWCLENFKSRFPNTKILVLSPIATTRVGFEPYMEEMRTGQEMISNLVGVYFERMTANPLFNNANWNSSLFYADTAHPTPLGYQIISGWVYDKI